MLRPGPAASRVIVLKAGRDVGAHRVVWEISLPEVTTEVGRYSLNAYHEPYHTHALLVSFLGGAPAAFQMRLNAATLRLLPSPLFRRP